MAAPSCQRVLSQLTRGSPRPLFTAGWKTSRPSRTGRNLTASRKPYGYKFSTDPLFVEKVCDIEWTTKDDDDDDDDDDAEDEDDPDGFFDEMGGEEDEDL